MRSRHTPLTQIMKLAIAPILMALLFIAFSILFLSCSTTSTKELINPVLLKKQDMLPRDCGAYRDFMEKKKDPTNVLDQFLRFEPLSLLRGRDGTYWLAGALYHNVMIVRPILLSSQDGVAWQEEKPFAPSGLAFLSLFPLEKGLVMFESSYMEGSSLNQVWEYSDKKKEWNHSAIHTSFRKELGCCTEFVLRLKEKKRLWTALLEGSEGVQEFESADHGFSWRALKKSARKLTPEDSELRSIQVEPTVYDKLKEELLLTIKKDRWTVAVPRYWNVEQTGGQCKLKQQTEPLK